MRALCSASVWLLDSEVDIALATIIIYWASLPFRWSGMYFVWRTFHSHWSKFNLAAYSFVKRVLPGISILTCIHHPGKQETVSKSTVNEVEICGTNSNGKEFSIKRPSMHSWSGAHTCLAHPKYHPNFNLVCMCELGAWPSYSCEFVDIGQQQQQQQKKQIYF